MKALGALVLLAGWVLLTDSRALQTFGSEAALQTEWQPLRREVKL